MTEQIFKICLHDNQQKKSILQSDYCECCYMPKTLCYSYYDFCEVRTKVFECEYVNTWWRHFNKSLGPSNLWGLSLRNILFLQQ